MVTPSLFGEEWSAWRWWWRICSCAWLLVLVGGHFYKEMGKNKVTKGITLCWYVPVVLAR